MLEVKDSGAIQWAKGASHMIPAKQVKQLLKAKDSDQVLLKLFTPDANATWYITELEKSGNDYIGFGLCDLGMGFPELGYVSLNELADVRGKFGLHVERDMYFSDKTLDECR